MLRSLLLLFFFLTGSVTQAAVWPTTSQWNGDWERRYEEWVKASFRTDIFRNAQSPFRGLYPDCADTVYSMRAIFASQNGLPFAFVDPSTQRTLISNEIQKFDALPAGAPRVAAFLKWTFGILGTSTLQNDTYPVAISRRTVRAGGLMLAKESKHSYIIKKLNETGVPVLYYSTQANTGDLKVRSWPSVSYLFSQGIKEPSGIRDFRLPEDLLRPVWEVPGYSNEQYLVGPNQWVGTMQSRLALRQESWDEIFARLLGDVCQLAETRVELVNNAQRKLNQIGDRCLTAAEFDDLSTPSRDHQAKLAFTELANAYQRARKKNVALPRVLSEQLANIFAPSASREAGAQYCPVKYGRTISLGEFRRRLFGGLISSNPNDPLPVRWGEQPGPSERAQRCPSF